ncbi:L-type lectin-domain containing receptor kinase IX.1-like [Gastrolobium bilobum]|uniref:L-type lectin-domain containing receptor kinase IX.1-like n=1 Tax=Gastrolobium bilobum TaxID=150636 RepID=UPI002AAF8BA3|nr:L-type lectin-domain containing receptor kinase IX.1-like [Gastrolobium bilobum]
MTSCGWHFSLHATTPLFCYSRITILLLLIIPLAYAQTLSFDYPNFINDGQNQLKLEGDASTSDSGIQITSNNRTGSIGRVTFPEPVHLWDSSTKEKKDFSTNFSFVLFSNQSSYGDGLAFFLASPNLPSTNDKPELNGGGLGIGLADANQNLIKPYYSFVAVEFDTFSNRWDPNGAHVAVNINSMESDILEEWTTDISKGEVHYCYIEYDSRNNNLNVSFNGYISYDGNVTHTTQYFSYNIDIGEYLPESVIVGISAATGANYEEHTLISWSFSTSNADPKKERWLINTKLLVGIGIGIGLSLILLGLVHIILWKMNKGKEEPTSHLKMDDEHQMGTRLKKFSYYELASATNNFEDTQKLGQGGFGGFYKGYLKASHSFAAIKRISANSRQDIKQYAAEVKIISQLRHGNLVRLTGWCHKKNDLLLVYEYMPNGSLDSHLFRGESILSLSWQVRYNIALGLASALFYLQEGWEKCVLHRDIKSSNIMLDSNFNAKLGDFGLARLVEHEKGSQTTVVARTMGYLAPESINTGKAGKESDIFSFGVVLLELASGRKAIHHNDKEGQVSLVEWIWELYGFRNLFAAADPKLCGVFDVQQMGCMLAVGLWCANPDFTSRPSIMQVIKVLSFEAPLPILPQKTPVIVYFPPTTNEPFHSVSSSFGDTS